MFLPIKALLDHRPRKDGTAIISIQYCFSSERRTLLFPGLAVPPHYWNKRLLRISPDLPTEYGEHENLNAELQRMIRIAEDIVLFTRKKKIKDPLNFLIKTFHPNFDTATLSGVTNQEQPTVVKKTDTNPDTMIRLPFTKFRAANSGCRSQATTLCQVVL